MVKIQFLVLLLLTGFCVFYCDLVSSSTESDRITFKNVTVRWCNDSDFFSPGSCIRTIILNSSTLSENIPEKSFTYITITRQNIPVLYENSVANVNVSNLEVSNCGLATIKRGSFQYLKVKYDLVLNYNKLETLRKGMFNNTIIGGGLNLAFNSISVIEEGTFENMTLLKLILAGNRLEEITGALFNNISVGRIDLRENKIRVIHREVFQKVRNLELLTLSDNKIKLIEPGSFDNLPNLLFLNLENNSLKTVPKDIFNSKQYLQLLLSRNHIRSISPGAFHNSSFENLALDHNKLEEIGNGIFNDCVITYLYLDRNNIREIESSALDKVYGGVHLDSNELRVIKRGTFKHAVVLVLLNNRNLKRIEAEAFNGTIDRSNDFITRVPKLYLEKNSTLDEESLQYLKNLTESGRFVWLEHIDTNVVILND